LSSIGSIAWLPAQRQVRSDRIAVLGIGHHRLFQVQACMFGVCREAFGLRVLLENGIEDEKASAGCPSDDRESSLDRP